MRAWTVARGALMMGVIWAAAWGGVVGGGIEFLANILPDFEFARRADIWIFELGIPGFFAGALFSVLLRVAEPSRRFDDLSLGRFAALGAMSGIAVIALLAAVSVGIGSRALTAVLARAAVLSVPVALLGAATSTTILGIVRLRDRAVAKLAAGQQNGALR
jgi:hypothetical protein